MLENNKVISQPNQSQIYTPCQILHCIYIKPS